MLHVRELRKKNNMNLLCKLGFHKEEEMGRATYPLDDTLDLVGFKCVRCGRFADLGLLEPKKKA